MREESEPGTTVRQSEKAGSNGLAAVLGENGREDGQGGRDTSADGDDGKAAQVRASAEAKRRKTSETDEPRAKVLNPRSRG
jgi:hypothetical protein